MSFRLPQGRGRAAVGAGQTRGLVFPRISLSLMSLPIVMLWRSQRVGRREEVVSCWMMTSLLYYGDLSIVRRLHYFYITQHFELQHVHTHTHTLIYSKKYFSER